MGKLVLKKKIIVACIGAVATSTLAAEKIEKLAADHHLNIEICQCRIVEIQSNLDGASLIVPTANVRRDYGIPVVPGMPFITGIGLEETERRVLEVLEKD